MTRTCLRSFTVLTLAAAAAACGDDPVSSGDQLTDVEAQELAFVLLGAAFETGMGSTFAPAAVDGPAAAPFTINGSVDDTYPCDLGGSVRTSGTYSISGDDATGDFDLSFDVDVAHAGCVVEGETKEFTLTTGMSVQFTLITTGGTDIDWVGDVGGSVDWAAEGRSGSCVVDYSFDGSVVAETSIELTLEGEVCGVSVARDFTYSAVS